MTLMYLTLAFVGGCVFWHKLGGVLLKKLGLKGRLRADLIRNLDTDTLVVFQQDTERELTRRHNIIVSREGNA